MIYEMVYEHIWKIFLKISYDKTSFSLSPLCFSYYIFLNLKLILAHFYKNFFSAQDRQVLCSV